MNKNRFLNPCFNQPRCHGNNTHPSQNARINTFVINLDSCKKRAPKDKWFKSYGELGIGTWKLCSATLSARNCRLTKLRGEFRNILHANFFMFILLISNHTVFLEAARAISTFWKTHSFKLIPNWTRNRMITYTNTTTNTTTTTTTTTTNTTTNTNINNNNNDNNNNLLIYIALFNIQWSKAHYNIKIY